MNLKTPNICAKRAKKCNIWYILNKFPFPKLKKITKQFKTQTSREKNSSDLEKNSSFLAPKLNEPVVGHYTPLPQKWSKKKKPV